MLIHPEASTPDPGDAPNGSLKMSHGSLAESSYARYQAEVSSDIAAVAADMGCQPILFIGSGLSKRYFSGPSWDELLAHLADTCPLIDKEYTYYKQTISSPLDIGKAFSDNFQEWAWSTGRNQFPKALYDDRVPADAYIKFKIAEYLESITPSSLSDINDSDLKREIEALRAIAPHAIITTNYDRFLELVFPDYVPVIGQKIITNSFLSIGEIFKIHGCVSDPNSLVFTRRDYNEFTRKKKYLSAKLLTYFSEHPLFFVGYGAGDPNVRAILSDIDEALPVAGGLIPNVYIVEWRASIPHDEHPAREKLIAIEDAKSVRIKAIETDKFEWVYRAFVSQHVLQGVNIKALRALLARSYELVRCDIPRKTYEVDYQTLEHAVDNADSFAKLFGITTISDPSVISAQYPYTLTDVAKKLGKKSWHDAHKIICRIFDEKQFNMKTGDNKYDCAIKYGNKNIVHKYSDNAVHLLKKVQEGHAYEV